MPKEVGRACNANVPKNIATSENALLKDFGPWFRL